MPEKRLPVSGWFLSHFGNVNISVSLSRNLDETMAGGWVSLGGAYPLKALYGNVCESEQNI